MSAKEPGPCWLRIEESRGSEACVDITNGALIARELEVKLVDVVFEASDPSDLLRMAVASLFLALTDKFRKLLDEISNLGCASTGERRADHTDDGGGKGAQVVVSSGRSVQQKLLGGRSDFGGLGSSL